MSKKLYYVEQGFWCICAILMMVFTGISFITNDMKYTAVCLFTLIPVTLIGFIVFEVFEVFEDLMDRRSEEEA